MHPPCGHPVRAVEADETKKPTSISFLRFFSIPIPTGIQLHNDFLRRFSAPALESLDGDEDDVLDVGRNSLLERFDLPALRYVGNDLDIYENPSLASIEMKALAKVKSEVDIFYNQMLAKISLPALVEVGEIEIYDNPNLQVLSMPVLTTVHGEFYVGHYDLEGMQGDQIESLVFPKLATIKSDLEIYGNHECCSRYKLISFPELTSVGDVDISDIVTAPGVYTAIEMPKLATVLEHFEIYDNGQVNRVSFPKLSAVGKDFWIGFYHAAGEEIESLEFPELQRIGNDMRILGLPKLKKFAFPKLAQIGGVLEIRKLVNEAIPPTPLAVSFPKLTVVGTHLLVGDSGRVARLDAPLLQWVGRDLYAGDLQANLRNTSEPGFAWAESKDEPIYKRIPATPTVGQYVNRTAPIFFCRRVLEWGARASEDRPCVPTRAHARYSAGNQTHKTTNPAPSSCTRALQRQTRMLERRV